MSFHQHFFKESKVLEFIVFFQIIFPIFIFIINSLNGSFIILLSIAIKLFYIILIFYFYIIVRLKKNLLGKFLFLFLILFYFIYNVYITNIFQSLILLIPLSTILIQMLFIFSYKDQIKFENSNLLFYAVLSCLILINFSGYIWHLLYHQDFRTYYRLVMPYLNPNFASSYLLINVVFISFIIKDKYKILILNLLLAFALFKLGSRLTSVAYCLFASYFFLANFKKPITFFIMVLSIISAFYSFKGRGNLIEQHFSFDRESRFKQLADALGNYVSPNPDTYNENNPKSLNLNNNLNNNSNNNSNNNNSVILDSDNIIISEVSSMNKIKYIFGFGNGIRTNNYFNLYHFLIKICDTSFVCLPTGLHVPLTTSYNSLTYMLLNGGLFLVIIFLIVTYLLPLIEIYKRKNLVNINTKILNFSIFLLITLLIGAGFPLIEFFPSYGLIIIIFILIKNDKSNLKI